MITGGFMEGQRSAVCPKRRACRRNHAGQSPASILLQTKEIVSGCGTRFAIIRRHEVIAMTVRRKQQVT